MAALAVTQLGSGPKRTPAPRAAPPVDTDRDGDGVADVEDRCVDQVGLPPGGCPPRDGDGDGVPDRNDRCADRAGPMGNQGCPDTDEDGDRVADRFDDCPQTYGSREFAGCRPPDRDRDGIPDPVDRCADRAEVWNGRRDRDGCPDRGTPRLEVKTGREVVLAGKLFRTSGSLTRTGRDALDVAADYLDAVAPRRVRAELVLAPGARRDDDKVTRRRSRALIERLRRKRARLDIVVETRPDPGKPHVVLTLE